MNTLINSIMNAKRKLQTKNLRLRLWLNSILHETTNLVKVILFKVSNSCWDIYDGTYFTKGMQKQNLTLFINGRLVGNQKYWFQIVLLLF
jgi:hypothetical protein